MALANVKHVVLVLSGKGGVGKSSITTQLALSLTLQGHNVGILDVDLTGPSIPRLLGIEDAKVKQAAGGWVPVPVHESQTLGPSETETTRSSSIPLEPTTSNARPTESLLELHKDVGAAEITATSKVAPASAATIGSLHAMSLAFLLASRSTAIVWRGPKKTAMIRQFLSTTSWPEGTDYLLVDTPPGTSDEHISLVETLLKQINDAEGTGNTTNPAPSLAGAVIVTTPQAVAVSDVRKELNFCAKTGVKVIGVVENMSGYVCPCCGDTTNLFSKDGGRIMAADFRVPFLGSVPVDPLWGVLVEEGKRPRYDQEIADKMAAVEVDDDDDHVGDEGTLEPVEDVAGVDSSRIKEPGLLVDKYRDCSLAAPFYEISRQVADCSEQGTAVMVGKV